METTETTNNKVPLSTRVDPAIRSAIETLAKNDERPVSNMVERLLKNIPEVQAEMERVETA